MRRAVWLLVGSVAFSCCNRDEGLLNGNPDLAQQGLPDAASGGGNDAATLPDATLPESPDLAMPNAIGVRPPCPSQQVVTLAAGRTGPTAIAVDGAALYWIETGKQGQLASMPNNGGAAPAVLTLIEGDMTIPVDLVLDETRVFYSSPGTGPENAGTPGAIWAIPKQGGGHIKLADSALADGLGQAYVGHPLALAADATNIYWTDTQAAGYSVEMFTLGQLLAVPKAGGARSSLLGNANSPSGLAVDAAYAYVGANNEAWLTRTPIGGNNDTNYVNAMVIFPHVLVDNDTLYLAAGIPHWGRGAQLFALAKNMAWDEPPSIYDAAMLGDTDVSDFAVDAQQRIFWSSVTLDTKSGHIAGIDKNGKNLAILAPAAATSIAVDDRYVYFTTADAIDVVCKQ
jgi:hypothetical protein